MFRMNVVGRTVDVYELKVENKTGLDNKPYESKSITFKVASNRNYTVSKTVNGVVTKERPSDFMFCKATGSLAQAIADYASVRKSDGKIVSRHLELHGHLETYTSTKKTVIEEMVPIGDKKYKIKFNAEVPTDQSIFIVKELEFLDSTANRAKVEPSVGGGSGIQVSEVVEEAIEINKSDTTTTVAPTPASTVIPISGEQEIVIGSSDTIPAPVLETTAGGNCPF